LPSKTEKTGKPIYSEELMSSNISSEQLEIINEFLQESRDMLDQLEPTIIELGQSCQNADCWETLSCANSDCQRHGRTDARPCWLDTGYVEGGSQTCLHGSSEGDCRSCPVFQLINGNGQTMNAIFRLFHSMKGSAGFLELNNISRVAHAAESLLDLIRSGKIKMEPEHVTHLCRACDFAREAMDYVETDMTDENMAVAADEMSERLAQAASAAQELAAAKAAPRQAPAEEAVESPLSPEDDLAMLISPEMVERFVQEADELLQNVELGLLGWDNAPPDADSIGALFRNVHSFKGNCGFFGYQAMEKLSHQMETVLDAVKSGEETASKESAEILLASLDCLRTAVADLSEGGRGDIEGLDRQLAVLNGLLTEQKGGVSDTTPEDGGNCRSDEAGVVESSSEDSTGTAPKAEAEEQEEAIGGDSRLLGEILVEEGVVSPEAVEAAKETQRKPLGELLVEAGQTTTENIAKALDAQKKAPPQRVQEEKPKQAVVNRQDIRVDLAKLDDLINLIGEMVIAENMLLGSPDLEGLELDNFSKAAQQMSKLVRDLQEMAMLIRMVPVSGLFRRMIRLVHDLSVKSGKKVDLQLFGQETEVDKTVIEQITDPLVHLLRNSLDHGLEAPMERVAAGKAEKGVVKLSACHQEGEVWITVEDDGRGLNREKILAKARSKGLVAGTGEQMSDKEVFNLIFQPGFSTAEKVTDVSGRGVGMDVVKQNLEKIKGKIEVHSRFGKGTRIHLRIPLTLAIIDGMLVRVGEAKCIVPLLAIREIFRPDPEAITVIPDGPQLVRVRDKFFPVKHLYKILQEKPDSPEIVDGVLIVLENQDNNICLLVDEIVGQQQTVIKGLSEYLGNVTVASGCTILGNGEVCLILDVATLTEGAGRARMAPAESA
jgi:two-component system chemotaxis sensor kinase CheA